MIESRYWKEDLLAHSKRLKPTKKPKRWSEKAVVNFEKEILISFFMIRILLENKKTSVKSVDYRVPVRRAPWSGKKITQLNLWHIEGHYDFANEVEARVSLQFLVNQFIHCKLIHATRDRDRNWSEIFVCSDFEMRKALYRISMDEIRKIFSFVGADYGDQVHYKWDAKIDDYQVTLE